MAERAFARSAMLVGREGMARLGACRAAVFGIGGVGGFAAEALVRSGIGAIDLVDGDLVQESNLNRQIIATRTSLGRNKAELMRERALAVNPRCRATAIAAFYTEDTSASFDLSRYDYVLDCVDMVSAKLRLAQQAARLHVPLISAMGAGNKLDPGRLKIADIMQTSVCPLARAMRSGLRRLGIDSLTVVFSDEEPLKPACLPDDDGADAPCRTPPGSMVFVPAAMGLMMAGHVVRALIG